MTCGKSDIDENNHNAFKLAFSSFPFQFRVTVGMVVMNIAGGKVQQARSLKWHRDIDKFGHVAD